MNEHMYVLVCMYMCVCLYACIYVYMYVCICVCVCVFPIALSGAQGQLNGFLINFYDT
jgi:hypothetical protein